MQIKRMKRNKTISILLIVLVIIFVMQLKGSFKNRDVVVDLAVNTDSLQTSNNSSIEEDSNIAAVRVATITELKNATRTILDNQNKSSKASRPKTQAVSIGLTSKYSAVIDTVHSTRELIQSLVQSLRSKLALVDDNNVLRNIPDACQRMGIEYNDTCKGTDRICPQKVLPEDLQTRIEQLVLSENLQIPVQYREVIKNMSQEIKGYHDLIVVSGLSSNHYLEAQALFKQLHEEVFPVLKNFTFVVYNLGLTKTEASQVRKHCRCQLVDFPFESFPPHFKTLKCFGFKPAVVRALIEKAEVVLWTDTSFRTSRNITRAIDRARKFGMQQRCGGNPSPSHTLEQTFHYFGDSPCAHMAFHQVAGGFGIYHNELLIKKAVLDPWLACGLRRECTCPVDQRKVQGCPSAHLTKKIGLCQRNDQSSMSIILAKLFREKFYSFAVSMYAYDKPRVGRAYQYFQELENATAPLSGKHAVN